MPALALWAWIKSYHKVCSACRRAYIRVGKKHSPSLLLNTSSLVGYCTGPCKAGSDHSSNRSRSWSPGGGSSIAASHEIDRFPRLIATFPTTTTTLPLPLPYPRILFPPRARCHHQGTIPARRSEVPSLASEAQRAKPAALRRIFSYYHDLLHSAAPLLPSCSSI
jgi:hypothetical protein